MAELSSTAEPTSGPVPQTHFFADLYTFDWDALSLRLPAVSAAAVALCVLVGLAVGHPGGALVAGGGALTVGFGANQRIADSRVWPMLLAVLAMASATLVGTVVGHRGFALLAASVVAAAIYGFLTIRDTGVAWVAQQAAVSLFVASAFPSGPRLALQRAGLITLGGLVQTVITSAGLRAIPELRKDLLGIPGTVYGSLYLQRRHLLRQLRGLPQSLPAPDRRVAATYALRLSLTVLAGTELYRRLGIQSGYWVPMTALLVQKPALFETVNRGLLRVAGTLAGATLSTLLVAHVAVGPWGLGALAVVFAFGCFATTGVNYGLYSVCITSNIVFLLSLNQIPGPELAHRRMWCTVAGAAIALAIHLDGLRRHRETGTGA